MKELIIASNNRHKIEEITSVAHGRLMLLSLTDIGCSEEIPEDYETLQENARAKARYIYDKYGRDCFADDTGLFVEALNGEPGVYSARYAGLHASYDDNVRKLLNRMENQTNRRAEFRTVICLIESGIEKYFTGICKGHITEQYKGTGGFGYDPVFVPEGMNRTFAEMTMQEKNSVSHRSLAIRQFLDYVLLEHKKNVFI
ncbi:MAG: RdgB/HAM1 family non-canonical purine NTP pyrophosphatase [Bacteroidales bacterium]|nr:RdgB/HAM1 family non-canonical purine NTP pyrophosphatase [Bacteroidales bacterium]